MFWLLLQEINGTELERVLVVHEQLRGPAPKDELTARDGKEPKHGVEQSVMTAVCVPSQYYLASGMVDTKTNEIPVARLLFEGLVERPEEAVGLISRIPGLPTAHFTQGPGPDGRSQTLRLGRFLRSNSS